MWQSPVTYTTVYTVLWCYTLTLLYPQLWEMRGTGSAPEEGQRQEGLCADWSWGGLRITPAAGGQGRGCQEPPALRCVRRLTKTHNNARNESPESHLWGLQNVSLSQCELLSHHVHVRQTEFSSQRAPLNHCCHQINRCCSPGKFFVQALIIMGIISTWPCNYNRKTGWTGGSQRAVSCSTLHI